MTKALKSYPVSCIVFRKLHTSLSTGQSSPIPTPIQEDWKEHLHLTLVPHTRIIVIVLKN